jgi:type II secretion system protein N
MAIHLGPRARKAVRIAAFIVFGLVTFVFALQMTLPYDRAKDRAIERLADKGWDMSVGDVERSWIPGRVYLHSVRLTSHTSKPDEIPMIFFIKDLKVDVELLTMLGGNFSLDIDAKVANGRLTAKLEAPLSFGAGTYVIKAEGKDLASDALPMQTVALQPTKGDLNLSADVSLTIEPLKSGKVGINWQKLEGDVEVACPSNCVYGDGKTKLKMKMTTRNKSQAEFGKDGIEFGIIKIDSLLAQLEAKNGKLTLSRLDAKSADGELKADFTMDLQQDVSESGVAGCISYKGSEELLKRDQRSFDAISLIGGALGPDKLFHIRLSEKWHDIKKQGIVCGGGAGNMDEPGGTNPTMPTVRRPNLAVQPEPPTQPPPQVTPPPPPPMPTPAPPPPTGSAATAVPVDPEHPPGSAPPGAYVPPGQGSAAPGSGSAAPVPEGSSAPAPAPAPGP